MSHLFRSLFGSFSLLPLFHRASETHFLSYVRFLPTVYAAYAASALGRPHRQFLHRHGASKNTLEALKKSDLGLSGGQHG